MFEVNRRVDYALRIMIELARSVGQGRVTARRVARRTGVSKAFLHKITADLARAGLVRTYSGPTGGVMLARPAATINARHVVEAIDGPVCLNVCLLRPQECPRDATCSAHDFWADMQQVVVARLEATSLEDLALAADALARGPRQNVIRYVEQV